MRSNQTTSTTTFAYGRKHYELSNHLGNVLSTVSDAKLAVDEDDDGHTDYFEAVVKTQQDYYPFGMLMPERQYAHENLDYRYGFNGMEKDNEVKGRGNSYDFGARMYDSRLGRWLSIDPLARSYSFISSYTFALNTPIQAKDPDGRLVIFVNGFRKSDYIKYLKSKAFFGITMPLIGVMLPKPWEVKNLYEKTDFKNYWQGVDKMLMTRFSDNKAIYMDGMYSPHSTAQERYDRGVAEGKAIIALIKSGEIQMDKGETIKLAGHSHGAWHGLGVTDALSEAGYDVEGAFLKNPHQPDGDVTRIAGRKEYRTVQYSTGTDHVSSDQSNLGVGKIFVGESKMKAIDGAEFFQLNDCRSCELGGHPVNSQINDIANIKQGEKAYAGPKKQ